MGIVTANREIDRGLVLHLPLTEGGGAKVWDRSQYGNHGDLGAAGAAPTWVDDDRVGVGKCLSFDGSDYIAVPDIASLDITDEITVAVQLKTTTDPTVTNQRIVDKTSTGSDSYYIYLRGASDEIWFGVTTGYDVRWPMPAGLQDYWHSIIGTYDHELIRLYYDGIKRAEIAYTGDIGITAEDLIIGSSTGHASLFFIGLQDELRVYNRALSDLEALWLSQQRRRL